MKPIFTIHGGEYLFANEFEKRYPSLKLWLPAKDVGVDFLITDSNNKKTLSIQVKYSRDYALIQKDENTRQHLKSIGWFTFRKNKIINSRADYWVLINYEGLSKSSDFFFIKPKALLGRYKRLNRKGKIINSYLWVTQNGINAYEARDLKKDIKNKIFSGNYQDKIRDFTVFLNKWGVINKRYSL